MVTESIINGISFFDIPQVGSNEDAYGEVEETKYIKGGYTWLDSKGRVIIESNQEGRPQEKRINAKLILGNPESGEHNLKAFTTTSNETGQYIAARLDSSTGATIDMDIEGSIINSSKKDIISKARRVIITTEEDSVLNTKGNFLLSGNTLVINSGKDLAIESPVVDIRSREFTVGALDKMRMLSTKIELGKPFRDDNLPLDLQYDAVVTHDRLSDWWKKAFTKFINEYNKNVDIFNQHTHSGQVPPPSPLMKITTDTTALKTTAGLKSSKSVSVI